MRPLCLAAASVVLLSACASTPRQSSAPPPTGAASSASPATPVPGVLVATLIPTNASGTRISGKIRLVPTGRPDEYRAALDVWGGGYQNKFPWVLRTGLCGERGQELGNPTNYRLIEMGADGAARFTAPLTLRIPEGQTHHVAILASPSNRVIVSCGVLSFES
jgi:hypothetical protein